MRSHASAFSSPPLIRPAPKNGVLVVSGYGVRIAVERGQLVVSDGFAAERREGRYHRALSRLKRVVVIGHTGTISLEALRWLYGVGAAFVQIDADGTVINASAPSGLNDARLRRNQALALDNGVALAITRDLIRMKLEGQRRTLTQLLGVDPYEIDKALAALDSVSTRRELRAIEANAAAVHWTAWARQPMSFGRKDGRRVPSHWRTFGPRHSPLTGSPRRAANPANALLNYLYAIVEAEARIAALTLGLDPGMGLLHADQGSRNSFVCDLMEPVRPKVDEYLLTLLRTRTFAARDFGELRDGSCRIAHPITESLAETAPYWAKLIAPVAERVAKMLLGFHSNETARRRGYSLPTILTQMNRSAGRGRRRLGSRPLKEPSIPKKCDHCGALVAKNRQYCNRCLPEIRAEMTDAFAKAGAAAITRLNREGRGPSQRLQGRKKYGQRISQRNKEIRLWEAINSNADREPEIFRRDILPQLHDIPLSALVRATGLSLRYCSLIRRGDKVPHPRHWSAFAALGTAKSVEPQKGGKL